VPREVQTHPVSDKIEHADFLEVDAKSEVKVMVPVHITGAEKSIGMKRGGVLNVVSHQVALLCNVTKIPASVDIDVTNLNIGSSIHSSNVALPDGVRAANKRVDATIVRSLVAQRKKKHLLLQPQPLFLLQLQKHLLPVPLHLLRNLLPRSSLLSLPFRK